MLAISMILVQAQALPEYSKAMENCSKTERLWWRYGNGYDEGDSTMLSN
jgi:hypothetical protein